MTRLSDDDLTRIVKDMPIPVPWDRDTAGGGSEALNDIDPDRLPTGGGAKKPGHKLGVGNGDPLDELQQALRDSNATGGNRE